MALRRIPEVEGCLMVAKPFDYLLTVRTRDMMHFRLMPGGKTNKLPGIFQTNSFVVMKMVRESVDFRGAVQTVKPHQPVAITPFGELARLTQA